MVLVTLVADSEARIGNRFYYNGPSTECKECKLRNVCFNLEAGSLYEVTGLRDTKHECILAEMPVRVVEVEKRAFLAIIPKKLAFEGSKITFEARDCDEIGCENWKFCHPQNTKDGEKYSIINIIETIDCPLGDSLKLVKLE